MKKVLFLIGFVVVCLTSRAEKGSVLWWMVDTKQFVGEMDTYSKAVLYVQPSGGSDTIVGYTTSSDQIQRTGYIDSYLGDSYSFWIELLNNADVSVGASNKYTYSDIKKFITVYDSTSPSSIPGASWAPPIVAVPEPTSGMLLLFGLAGLALRRRQKV